MTDLTQYRKTVFTNEVKSILSSRMAYVELKKNLLNVMSDSEWQQMRQIEQALIVTSFDNGFKPEQTANVVCSICSETAQQYLNEKG